MLYNPRSYKYLKQHCSAASTLCNSRLLSSFRYYIISSSFGLITKRQIETLRKFLSRRLRKKHKVYCRFICNSVVTKKALKVRMGKGCGDFDRWLSYIRPGMVLFELSNIKKGSNVFFIFKSIGTKMPFNCKLLCLSDINY